jgi:YfiR/HmsC-like
VACFSCYSSRTFRSVASRRKSKLWLWAIPAVSVFVSTLPLAGQKTKPTQFDVEAAYLYQFSRFVQWPAANSSSNRRASFPICVLGRDPFGRILDDTIRGETVDGVPLVAKRIDTAGDVSNCRVVFIGASEENRIAETLGTFRGVPVLTVSEISDFVARGGMVQFVLREGKVRFAINFTSAEKAGLTLSSQLLKVAVEVHRDSAPGTR